jgi:hypothetical protein
MDSTENVAPFPAPPSDGELLIWMRVAWLASGALDRSSRATGLVALRRFPVGFDRVIAVAGSQGDDKGAIRVLIAQAARNGISLLDVTCFLFPGLGDKEDFQSLLDCGVAHVVVPNLPIPNRLKDDDHACRWAASSIGVGIQSIDLDAIFSPLLDLHG